MLSCWLVMGCFVLCLCMWEGGNGVMGWKGELCGSGVCWGGVRWVLD